MKKADVDVVIHLEYSNYCNNKEGCNDMIDITDLRDQIVKSLTIVKRSL